MKLWLVLVLGFAIAPQLQIEGARILGIFAFPGRSLYILGQALLKGLAEKGHDVTMISCYEDKTPPQNGTYRDVVLTGVLEKRAAGPKRNMFQFAESSPFFNIYVSGKIVAAAQEIGLSHENVQKLIHSKEKFDVVIVPQFVSDAQKALALHFGAPLVAFSPVGANYWVNSLVGNPSPPSYVPDVMAEYTHPMSIYERLLNTILTLTNEIFYNSYIYPNFDKQVKKHISEDLSVYDILYNASIVLMNSHPSINQAVPYVPNMIDIGGFHVKPPKKLPDDLQKFLDDAKEGVIYFSMGSNLKSADLPIEKRDAILRTFAKLKQKVLWKWEDDVLPGQPENVKLGKWLPQQDILAHPNVKVFVTHGGYLSTTETIYHGVPILAIPILGDQKLNANRAIHYGYGLLLPYSQITEQAFSEKLHELLHNPKYRENAKLRSRLFHDRLVGPMDTAIYWVEYVVRHGGAPHLRVAGLDLPWYKYHLLDVIAFVALLVLLGLFVSYKAVKTIYRNYCSKNNKKVKKH